MGYKIKILFTNLLILLICCFLIEMYFGGWINKKNKIHNIGRLTEVEDCYSIQDLYQDSSSTIHFTRDLYGFRGIRSFNKPENIDILTVGGSTTEQMYIDDKRTWQVILEQCFKDNNQTVCIANAGVNGQSTFGHIKNFEMWFPNIPKLNPKYIIYYIGINDFFQVSERDNYDVMISKKTGQIPSQNSLFKILQNNSVIYNLYRKLIGSYNARIKGVSHAKIDLLNLPYTDRGIADKKLFKFYSAENLIPFTKRIRELIELTKNMGAIPIFITQPSMNFKYKSGKLLGVEYKNKIGEYYYNGIDYFYLYNMLNKAIKEAVHNQHIVVDLTNLKIWEPEHFYDFYHNTPIGSQRVGLEIFKQLNGKLKFTTLSEMGG